MVPGGAAALPQTDGPVLEVGSGPGFLRDLIPNLITSDILRVNGLSVVLDGSEMPFATGSLRDCHGRCPAPRLPAQALHQRSGPLREAPWEAGDD